MKFPEVLCWFETQPFPTGGGRAVQWGDEGVPPQPHGALLADGFGGCLHKSAAALTFDLPGHCRGPRLGQERGYRGLKSFGGNGVTGLRGLLPAGFCGVRTEEMTETGEAELAWRLRREARTFILGPQLSQQQAEVAVAG